MASRRYGQTTVISRSGVTTGGHMTSMSNLSRSVAAGGAFLLLVASALVGAGHPPELSGFVTTDTCGIPVHEDIVPPWVSQVSIETTAVDVSDGAQEVPISA